MLLILACPLMMIWMMRGMHGGTADAGNAQGHAAGCSDGHHNSTASLDELRRQRDQLDREIEQREADEQTPTPVGGGWR